MAPLNAISWIDDHLVLLDQTRLPEEAVYLDCRDYRQVAEAIKVLRVRGAPAIGVAAAFGLALAAQEAEKHGMPAEETVKRAAEELRATRPTAVNLAWALERVLNRLPEFAPGQEIAAKIAAEAVRMLEEDQKANRAMGRAGQALLRDGEAVLTHCNAGALATTGYGTALGVIRAAVEAGKRISVFADETRPLLQGARLTVTELLADGIPTTLICDDMAASLMRRGMVQAVIVGADRIARNGDVANKIGTYGVAVLARHHGLPFYVAAPMSTYDPATPGGDQIPIEEREGEEVRRINGRLVTRAEVPVWNPAFDVTPAELVTAIITERGVAQGDLAAQLAAWSG